MRFLRGVPRVEVAGMNGVSPRLAKTQAQSLQKQRSLVIATSPRIRPSSTRLCSLSPRQTRALLTLAIESSCDDTSVAILEKQTGHGGRAVAQLHFHEKVTSNNLAYRGVHPAVALVSHQRSLAKLIQQALIQSPQGAQSAMPDFVSVTRGPGMRSNVSVGLDTAKGLSLAWGVPLLAVNHMQAHALTPRLVTAMEHWPARATKAGADSTNATSPCLQPEFPFLSLLVSGGHTMLIHSKSICNHPTLAATSDTAIGDFVDKVAREILPTNILHDAKSAMYGPILEQFAFPPDANGNVDYKYTPPPSRQEHMQRRMTPYGWGLAPPLSLGDSGKRSRDMEFSFAGLGSSVKRIMADAAAAGRDVSLAERQLLAQEAQRVAFEHLASRVHMALQTASLSSVQTLVVSGGVAANRFLKHLLRSYLDVRGCSAVEIVFPPLELCTDNAAMIAWAGMEMYEAGWRSELSCEPLRRWSLDPGAEDGGILGVGDWVRIKDKSSTVK